MTREEKIEMFTMRVDGATLQECADKYGITRERVRQIISNPNNSHRGARFNPNKYRNRSLAKAISEKYGTVKKFSQESGLSPSAVNRVLNGGGMSAKTINKVLKYTGLTYEEAFSDDEE